MKFLDPEWHDKLSSTNTVLLDLLKNEETRPSPGFVLAALEQTAGHGRYNRHWISKAGRDLTFSFVISTRKDLEDLASLSQAIALGTASALDTFGILTQTKWPNDILVRGQKIGGILSEQSEIRYEQGQAIVVGVGINVNMQDREEETLIKTATSLRIETGKKYAIKSVLDTLLEILPEWINRWEVGGFPAIREDWIARCVSVGESVTVGDGLDRQTGTLAGFGEKGQLLLRVEDGVMREIWAADISR
ncbi:MAG: biotin--[acetyl-CoA-carboxylase] ligase [Candidatus Scalindua sp.]|nr:biotin--[acetyl-CoA-carboxylase] ligase [Candidatus Scalindua sp.]